MIQIWWGRSVLETIWSCQSPYQCLALFCRQRQPRGWDFWYRLWSGVTEFALRTTLVMWSPFFQSASTGLQCAACYARMQPHYWLTVWCLPKSEVPPAASEVTRIWLRFQLAAQQIVLGWLANFIAKCTESKLFYFAELKEPNLAQFDQILLSLAAFLDSAVQIYARLSCGDASVTLCSGFSTNLALN